MTRSEGTGIKAANLLSRRLQLCHLERQATLIQIKTGSPNDDARVVNQWGIQGGGVADEYLGNIERRASGLRVASPVSNHFGRGGETTPCDAGNEAETRRCRRVYPTKTFGVAVTTPGRKAEPGRASSGSSLHFQGQPGRDEIDFRGNGGYPLMQPASVVAKVPRHAIFRHDAEAHLVGDEDDL